MTAAMRLRCSGRAVDKQNRLTGKPCTRRRQLAGLPVLRLGEVAGVWHAPKVGAAPGVGEFASCTSLLLDGSGTEVTAVASSARCTAEPCATKASTWQAKVLAKVRAVGWRAIPTPAGVQFTCPACSPKPVVAPAATEALTVQGSAS